MKTLIKDTFIVTNIIIFAITILIGSVNLAFETHFQNKIYPGVKIGGVEFSGKSESDVTKYFTPILFPKDNYFFDGNSHN